MSALPIPQSTSLGDNQTEGVLEFFEKVVQKTLVSPIKLAVKGEIIESNFSPLLRNFLIALSNELTKDGQEEKKILGLLVFVEKLIFKFIGYSISIEFLQSLISELGNILGKVAGGEAKQLKKLLKDSLKVLLAKVEVKKGEGNNPISSNIFMMVGKDEGVDSDALAT